MQEKTRCIVLRTVKYGDRSLIIDLLTREYGRVSVIWRVPKLGKGGVRRQYFQPLSILAESFFQKPGGDRHYVFCHKFTSLQSIIFVHYKYIIKNFVFANIFASFCFTITRNVV